MGNGAGAQQASQTVQPDLSGGPHVVLVITVEGTGQRWREMPGQMRTCLNYLGGEECRKEDLTGFSD
jgi:hypothetical protein